MSGDSPLEVASLGTASGSGYNRQIQAPPALTSNGGEKVLLCILLLFLLLFSDEYSE